MTPAELRARRAELGLTQVQMGQVLAVAPNTVARWERGERAIGNPQLVELALDRLVDGGWTAQSGPQNGHACSSVDKRPRNNLPAQLSSFVGRADELATLRNLLGRVRLLTLTGVGGVGKTRLALELAAAVANEYADGVWLAELAPLIDASLMPSAIAAAMGVREQAGRRLIDTLSDALRVGHVLLVLDNCEHQIHAAAHLADTLLRACPGLQILATSREALGVTGEATWRVPPLSLPNPRDSANADVVGQCEAVRLFVERASAVDASFHLSNQNANAVADVCSRLEGIPLALELAAARTKLLSPEQIASRLDHYFELLAMGGRTAPARHQTLRAAVDWSYDLLAEPEKRLFERLSVFAGGWTLDAAEAVCSGDGIPADQTLEMLGRLVDRSLVLTERGSDGRVRYRLLDVLRRYGEERLSASGDGDTVRARHAAYCQRLAEQALVDLWGRRCREWFDTLELEHDNIRAALRWLIDSGATEQALQLAAVFWRFWSWRGKIGEGRAWIRTLLAIPGHEQSRARVKLLSGAAMFACLESTTGDFEAAESLLAEALPRCRQFGSSPELGHALFMVGLLAKLRGDFAVAKAFLEEGLEVNRAIGWGNEHGCLVALANIAYAQGHFVEARERANEARKRASEQGYSLGLGYALRNLGAVSYQEGDFASARLFLQQSLDNLRNGGPSPDDECVALIYLGWVARDNGESSRARAVFTEALTLARETGDQRLVAGCLESFAGLAAAENQAAGAIRTAAAASALREAIGAPIYPVEGRTVERWLVPARAALGEDAAAAAWAEGRAMTVDQACAEALSLEPVAAKPLRAEHLRASRLTRREQEVVALVAEGWSDRQIAEKLVIGRRTAESHVGAILRKLELVSRAQVAAWAVQSGVGSPIRSGSHPTALLANVH